MNNEQLMKHTQASAFLFARIVVIVAILACGAMTAFPQAKEAASAAKEKTSAALPAAKEVIARYVKAMGGRDTILQYTSTHVKGQYEVPGQGLKGTLEVFAAKPDKLKVKVELPGLGQVMSGHDGKVGWSIDPALGPMIMEGKRLSQLQNEANYYSILHDEKEFKSMETVEVTEFEGKECYKLKLVRQSGDEATEFYDTKTGLLAGLVASQETPLGAVTVTSVASDYKKFGNVHMATKNIQRLAGLQQVMTVESVEYNKVADAEFELPPQIKALVNK